MLTVVLPLRYADLSILPSFYSIQSSINSMDNILVGIQDVNNSDQEVVNWLEQQPKTKVHINNYCKNLSSNLNNLLMSVKTKYAVRMDGDDLMHPQRLRQLERYLDEQEPAIVGQSYIPIYKGRLGRLVDPLVSTIENKMKLLLGVPFAHPAISLNLEKIGERPYDENYNYAQDYHLYVDKIESGSFNGYHSKAIYYNVPDVEAEVLRAKRMSQLASHEAAMFKIWKMLGGLDFTVDQKLIHAIRCHLVTPEYARLDIDNETRRYCLNCLRKSELELRRLLS